MVWDQERAERDRLEAGLRVRAAGAGVRVAVRVPSVLSDGSIFTVRSRAAFPDQRP